ncbi:hypothetical protein COOONC_11537 [Cooperia oncophora]
MFWLWTRRVLFPRTLLRVPSLRYRFSPAAHYHHLLKMWQKIINSAAPICMTSMNMHLCMNHRTIYLNPTPNLYHHLNIPPTTQPASPTALTSTSIILILFVHIIFDDFGDDIAYGQPETSPSASVQEVPSQSPAEPDFSFIDNIYESVRAEIEAEKAVSSPSRATPEAPSTPPVITLGVGSPVTIVSADGKEYKVVLQEVKHEPKTGSKRKSSTSVTESAPKPKRAPGIPLANLSIEEINARKREQNRIAAQRYREKKKNSKETEKEVSIVVSGHISDIMVYRHAPRRTKW